MDGYITIGTKVDTKGAEEGLEELYNLIDNSDVAKGRKTTVVGDELKKEAKEAKVAFEDVFDETQEMAEISGIDLLNDQIALVTDKLEALKIEYADIKAQEPYAAQSHDLLEYAQKISTTEKQLERLNQQADALNNKGFNALKKSVDDVGKGLTKTVNSVKRWVLGIFGVYSAYGAIRNAMNVISSQDEQLKADIDYMKNALAYTLEPVVRKIVELAKQLMTYIGYIIYQWTGYNIFENANKSLKKANGQAKALQKTMAGFDEMNVLNDSSGSGGATPSFDLTIPTETQGWVTRLPGLLAGIGAGIGALKLGELLYQLGLIPQKLSAIKAIGIGMAITGVVWTIQDLIKFLNDPTFNNFISILGDISLAIIGIGIAAGSLPAIIAGIIGGIIYLFLKNYDTIMQKLKDFDKFMVWLWNKIKELFGPVGQIIFSPFMAAVIMIRQVFEDLLTSLKRIVNGIVMIFKGDLKGGVKEAFGGLVDIVKKPLNRIIDYLNQVIRGLNKVQIDMPDWLGGGKFGFNISTIPRLARGGIVNNPGRGVMMGNYVAGENGAEAVLPLTDDTLQRLANMIPITVNLTNTMNGRVISRELKKVQNEQDFAFNR